MEGRLGCEIDYLNALKLIYLVRNELILVKMKKHSLSRKISFQKHSKFAYDFVK
jgi:hypothetical protein